MDALTQVRLEFNRYLLDAIGGQILDTTVFGWNAGFTKWLLAFCMAIAFFQSVLRDEKSMLVEWTKIIIASWFCLAILGGVNATKVPVFSSMANSLPQDYKVKSRTTPTLERIVFNWMAWKFDQLGEAIMNDGTNSSFTEEVTKLVTIQDRLAVAIMNCDMSNAKCLRKYLTGDKDPATVQQEAKNEDSSWSILPKGVDMLANYASMVVEFIQKMSNPAYWLFPILIWLLDIARAFINFFVLLTFGIMAALSLFMIKVLCVLMVIPSYRGRVIGMFKMTLSASMYGFAMNLMLWISLIITKALNEATANIIINRLTSPSSSAAGFAGEMGTLMMANFLTSFVIMVMQIVAMAKVPKFTRNLMNLSLDEIVNIGETLFTASLGMAKIAAGVAAGVGGMALGAVGGAALGAATGKGVGAAGTSAGNMFKGLLGGSGGDGPTDVGGGSSAPLRPGGGGGSRMASGGNSTDSFFQGNPNFLGGPGRSGGGDLDKVALGEARLSAGQSGLSILKGETEEDEAQRALTVNEKKVQRDEQIAKIAGKAKSIGSSVGGTLMDMAWDGMSAGTEQGDGLSTFRKVSGNFNSNKADYISETTKAAGEFGAKRLNNLNPLKKPDYEQRAADAENVYRQAVVGGKRDMTEADTEMLSSNLAAIAGGSASNEQMRQVLEAQNTMNLSQEQVADIQKIRGQSENFNSLLAGEEDVNSKLMENIQKEFQSKKGISNKTMSELSARTNAGLMDYDALAKLQVRESKTGPEVKLGEALSKLTAKDISSAIDPMVKTLQGGGRLSVAEQQQASRMFDTQQNSLVGQGGSLDKFEQVLAGTRSTEHLRYSREDSTYVTEEAMKNLNTALANDKLAAEIADGFEMSLGSENQAGATIRTGEIDGFYLGGQAITNADDLNKLDPQNRRLFDEFYKSVDMAINDKETNNMVTQRVADLQLNSDNLRKLYDILKKVRGDGQ